MSTTTSKFSENLRIIWAIAAKDIVDALKNRMTLSVILAVLFMIVFYRFLPLLESGTELPRVLVYDAGESSLVAALEESSRLRLHTYPSQERMEFKGYVPELGLVIPADFDEALASDKGAALDGYVLHWVSDSDASELKLLVEDEIAGLVGQPVRIRLEGNTVYTQKDSTGVALTASFSVIFAVIMVGVSLIPHLMLEEKQTKTIDALLVSPAGSGHIVAGKALTGLFYGLTVTALVLAVNAALVTHWALAILTAICGILFVVSLGLLLGSLIETRQQLALWAWVVILPLLLPVFLSIMDDILPAGVITVMRWIPTVALSRALRVSFSNSAPLAQFGPELALVAGCAVPVLAAVAWLVRRSDQ
jgi:ABC-2 type transport system permease protein